MWFSKRCPECGGKMKKREGRMKDLRTFGDRVVLGQLGMMAEVAFREAYVRAWVCTSCENVDIIAARNRMGNWER
jgi:ssDNA-binding Zn-finger/Zn-ribbon topoisomerase 1